MTNYWLLCRSYPAVVTFRGLQSSALFTHRKESARDLNTFNLDPDPGFGPIWILNHIRNTDPDQQSSRIRIHNTEVLSHHIFVSLRLLRP